MRPNSPTLRAVPLTLALLSLAAACSKDAAGSSAGGEGARGGGAAQQGGPAGGGAAGSARGPAGGGGGPGGRPSPSITLAATDVATVAPMTIEDGVALTGDLRPLETIDVRSRIEGDLMGVYVREGEQVAAGSAARAVRGERSRRAAARAPRPTAWPRTPS